MIDKIIKIMLISLLLIPGAYAFQVELIGSDPAPIVAGEYADLTFRFSDNTEGAVKNNVRINIVETPLVKPTENGITISKIYSGNSITRTLRVYFDEDTPQGNINIPISIEYNEVKTETDVSAYVQESDSDPELYIGDIESTPNELLADTKDNKLEITLQNLGEKSAKLVKAELIADSTKIKPAYAYSLSDSISEIEEGEEGTLEFTIDIEEGVYDSVDAKLMLRYRVESNSGNTYDTVTEELDFVIEIAEAPFLKVKGVEQLDSTTVGSTENRIRVEIENDGVEEGTEVRIRLVPDVSYPFSFEQTTVYVNSKIKPGQSSFVEFKTEVLPSAIVKDYPITVLIESLVGETRYTQEDTITINVHESTEQSSSSITMYVLAIVLIIALGLGVYRFMDKRKEKKHKKK